MTSRSASISVWLVIAGCASHASRPANKAGSPGSSPCASTSLPTEIDLAAVDAKVLRQIDSLRRQGLVAVSLRASECGAEIEVISSCSGKGLYQYVAQQKRANHVVGSVDALRSLLPVGAARFVDQIADRRELLIESSAVGALRISESTRDVFTSDLRGTAADCDRVTHVISAIEVGEIGVLSGAGDSLRHASAIGAGALAAGLVRVVHEGDPKACERASRDSLETDGCTTPVHLSLLPLVDRSRSLPVEIASVEPPRPSAAPVPSPPPVATADPRPPIPSGMLISVQHLVVMHAGSMRGKSSVKRTREQARQRAEVALRRARAGEDFGTIVRQFTDEPLRGARPGGFEETGVLENIRGGMTVARFENIAFFLGVGEVSEVVETEFGFHVIKRLR